MNETWIGSGVNSIDKCLNVTCRSCDWEGDLDGSTFNSKYDWSAECPNCKNIIEYDLQEDELFADPDYDSWVDVE